MLGSLTYLKQFPGLQKTKIVSYSNTSMSTFGTIGNATADKMTAKVGEVVGKNSSFRFGAKN